MKLIFKGESLREIRDQVMDAAASFLKYGITTSPEGKVVAGPSGLSRAEQDFKRVQDNADNARTATHDLVGSAPAPAVDPHGNSLAPSAETVFDAQTELNNPPPKVKKKGGRPKKVVADDNEEEPIEEMEYSDTALDVPTTPAKVTATIDDCKQAVDAVYKKFGIDRARGVLINDFNVNKISELPAAAYNAFKTHCENVVKNG